MTQRDLGEACKPPLDFTTIARLERNTGYTSSTLERVAVALGVQKWELELPSELFPFTLLSPDKKQIVIQLISSLAADISAIKPAG